MTTTPTTRTPSATLTALLWFLLAAAAAWLLAGCAAPARLGDYNTIGQRSAHQLRDARTKMAEPYASRIR